MAKECSKHPGTAYTDLTSRPGRNGVSFSYRGCAKCKSEKEGGGMPPARPPTKTPAKAAKSATPPAKTPAKTPANQTSKEGGGFFTRAVRTLGLR
jgi:hypothetical protein